MMNNVPKYSLKEGKTLIQNGDIVLFRNPPFPNVGWWVAGVTGGIYSHVAIANRKNGTVTLIEQREWYGGREIVIESQKDSIMDVYRVAPKIQVYEDFRWREKQFTVEIGKRIVETARETTGSPYNWYNIWKIYLGYLPFYRMIVRNKKDVENISNTKICSESVSYAYRKNYADLVPNLRDDRTTPNDIACSALIFPTFTIVPENHKE